MSKLNRHITLSAVGAGVACPKTQNKLFSGERTSPLRTKRQHYPRFDSPIFFRFLYLSSHILEFLVKATILWNTLYFFIRY